MSAKKYTTSVDRKIEKYNQRNPSTLTAYEKFDYWNLRRQQEDEIDEAEWDEFTDKLAAEEAARQKAENEKYVWDDEEDTLVLRQPKAESVAAGSMTVGINTAGSTGDTPGRTENGSTTGNTANGTALGYNGVTAGQSGFPLPSTSGYGVSTPTGYSAGTTPASPAAGGGSANGTAAGLSGFSLPRTSGYGYIPGVSAPVGYSAGTNGSAAGTTLGIPADEAVARGTVVPMEIGDTENDVQAYSDDQQLVVTAVEEKLGGAGVKINQDGYVQVDVNGSWVTCQSADTVEWIKTITDVMPDAQLTEDAQQIIWDGETYLVCVPEEDSEKSNGIKSRGK